MGFFDVLREAWEEGPLDSKNKIQDSVWIIAR